MFGRGGGGKVQNMEKSMFFIFFFFDAFPKSDLIECHRVTVSHCIYVFRTDYIGRQ